jgi:hypothetical protein
MRTDTQQAIDRSSSWVGQEISGEIERSDAQSIARHLGGIVANDDRVISAIQGVLDKGNANAGAVLEAVAAVMKC